MDRDAQGYRTVRLRTLAIGAGLLLLLAVVVALWKREILFQQLRAQALGNMELAAEKYGWQMTQAVEAVEVFEIEESSKATNSVSIRIGVRTERHGYIAKRELTGSEAKAFLERWGKMRFHWGMSGLCHEPAFVVRFLKEDKAELETTLCFMCHNFQIPSLLGEATTMGFDQESPAGQAFVAQVKTLFPDSPKWAELEKQKQKKAEAKE